MKITWIQLSIGRRTAKPRYKNLNYVYNIILGNFPALCITLVILCFYVS